MHWRSGGLDIIVDGPTAETRLAEGWYAVTLGLCMYYWTEQAYQLPTLVHERVHIRQLLRYGIWFPILYLACYPIYKYKDNPFEIEARHVTNDILDLEVLILEDPEPNRSH